ncbi:MAG: tetratricopeptide repeat protein [Brevinematales bacterium]|jgi:tetratricopeptide (TPR) repeat protein
MFGDLVKIQDDLIIIFASIIVLFLSGIIILSLRALFLHQSIEKSMMARIKAGKYNEVIDIARDFINISQSKGRRNPGMFVLYYLAQAYEAIDSLNNALKYYTEASLQASKYGRMYSTILLHIAKISFKLGKNKEAQANYMMLLDKDPDNAEALYELACVHYRNRSLKKARECLETVLKKRSGLIEARSLYGKILFDTGNYLPALKQFSLLEKYDPSNYEVFYYKAKCFENLKKYAESIRAYQFILGHEWKNEIHSNNNTLVGIREGSQISVINLYIKIKDYHSGIYYVSEYLSNPSSEETKTELIYLYANLLWNTGEEYQALKNFERIYMMNPGYKDVAIMHERYKKILPHTYLKAYFTSNESSTDGLDFDSLCKRILARHVFKLMYRHLDYYIYEKGVFYVVFYRHIEPASFSKLTEIEVMLNSFQTRPQNIEIYSLSGIMDDAITHFLLKSSHIIEGDEFINTVKKIAPLKS